VPALSLRDRVEVDGATITRIAAAEYPLDIVRAAKIPMHHTANLKEAPMRFAFHRWRAVLAGICLTATLAGCACRPGYVGPYGGVRPARCWIW
jgi:hypothetical protein